MYYTYVLQSKKDNKLYVGYTHDLQGRLEAHNNGRVTSTKDRRPLKYIYVEACINKVDAMHRETYLKTYYGKAYLQKRLKSYFTGCKNS